MSVFNFPRIHFNGVMRVNVGTGNNDDYSSSDPGSSNNYLFRESPCPHVSSSPCPHLRTFDSKKVELNSCLEEKFSSPLDLIEWMKKDQDEFKHMDPSGSGKYVDASVTPSYWNYFGSMSMWSGNVKVTGVTPSPGNYISQPQPTDSDFIKRLIGDSAKHGTFSYFRWPHPPHDGVIPGDNKELGDVKTTAVMTDVKSEGSSPGSQIFADNLLLRDSEGTPIFYRKLTDGSYTGSGSKPSKASATRLDAGGNAYECFYAGVHENKDGSQSLVINPGGAAVFQCVMPFSKDFGGDPAYFEFLNKYIDAKSGRPKGIVVRYTMSAGAHFLNSSEEWAKLYAQDPKTSFFKMLNERHCPVAGTIAPWYGEEQNPATPDYDSITIGREISMAPMLAQKTVGWTGAPLGGHLPQSLSPIICRLQDYQSSASPSAERVFSIDVSKALTSYFTQVGGNISLYVGKDANDPSPVLICEELPYGNPANDHYIDVSTGKISADPGITVFATPQRGMVDVILDDALYKILSDADPAYPNGGTLIVKTDSSSFFTMVIPASGPPTFNPTNVLFQETPYGIINNKRTLYTEEAIDSSQPTTVTKFRYNGDELTESVFQIIHRGKVLTELPDPSVQKFYMLTCATIPLPDAYKNPVAKSLITCMDELQVVADVREPGSFRFAVVTEEQAAGIKTFQDLNNSPMVVAQIRVLPNEVYDEYFVDPTAAEPVGNEKLTFDVIYNNVFKPYHVLYPAMDQVRSLYDPAEWGGVDSARRLLGRLETKTFNDSSYMPRTRDLSASRRQLIQAWCRKTINAAKQATLLLLLILALSSCRTEPNANGDNATPEEMIDVSGLENGNPNPSVPYTLSVESVAKLTTGFHSYTFATYGDFWVVLGGRTNGFHGTEGREATFPRAQSNDSIYVIDSRTLDSPEVKIYSGILPEKFRASLSSTNMGFEQTEGYLYTIGGYGSSCYGQGGTDSCYQTFPYLTRISLGVLVRAVVNNDHIQEGTFQQIEDEDFRVTGGEMHMIDSTYYVVFGQNYPGIYKPGRTGEYTERIQTFKIVNEAGGFSITDRHEIKDPSGSSGANSEFHRRDLNVVPAVRSGGKVGLEVYGGVFNAEDEAFPHPISINGLNAEVKNTELKVGLYECGQVLLYDQSADKMHTSLLGGIGAYRYSKGKLVADPDLPFTRTISTVTHDNKSGEISEYIQPFEQSLPSWIGANAVFIPAEGIATISGYPEIIDFNALPGNGPIVIGHMIGGIHANGPQTAGSVGSYADNNVYAVTLNR